MRLSNPPNYGALSELMIHGFICTSKCVNHINHVNHIHLTKSNLTPVDTYTAASPIHFIVGCNEGTGKFKQTAIKLYGVTTI